MHWLAVFEKVVNFINKSKIGLKNSDREAKKNLKNPLNFNLWGRQQCVFGNKIVKNFSICRHKSVHTNYCLYLFSIYTTTYFVLWTILMKQNIGICQKNMYIKMINCYVRTTFNQVDTMQTWGPLKMCFLWWKKFAYRICMSYFILLCRIKEKKIMLQNYTHTFFLHFLFRSTY